MAAGRAWVLNLDADVELGAAGRYAPTRAIRTAMAPHVARLAESLLRPDDVLVDETSPPGAAVGRAGHAFCPTARAVAILVAAGALPERHPADVVLRRVNGRAFCAALGQTLPGAAFVRDEAAALAILERAPSIARSWRLKRAYGMAGRGQRVLRPGPVDDATRSFLRAAVGQHGVQIEPNVTIDVELARHGALAEDGALRVGPIVQQRCDPHGQWLSSERLEDGAVEPAFRAALDAEIETVARALRTAGYFGPFGLDAFIYRDLAGRRELQPRSEINARYAMGYAVSGLA